MQATKDEIRRAREKYAHSSDNNVEVDDDAKRCPGVDGVWVQAWVWLAHENDEEGDGQ